MTNDSIRGTWADRELPILRAALRRLDAGEDFPSIADIREEIGLDEVQMRAGLRALETASPPYLEVEGYAEIVKTISERARRELGSWPSAPAVVDELIAALEAAADDEPEEQRKGRLRSIAEGLGGFARDVAVQAVGTQLGGI